VRVLALTSVDTGPRRPWRDRKHKLPVLPTTVDTSGSREPLPHDANVSAITSNHQLGQTSTPSAWISVCGPAVRNPSGATKGNRRFNRYEGACAAISIHGNAKDFAV
jgi:hypothetical protein